MTRGEISEVYPDEDFLYLDPNAFDEAIMGIHWNNKPVPVIAYNRTKILEILMGNDEMSYEDALEYFNFNIEGAYVGERTPIYIDTEVFE